MIATTASFNTMDPFLVKERRDQQHKQSRIKERDLGSSSEDGEDAYQSFLTKRSGVEYDPYALAWRYLGMYIDCDITFETSEESPEERSRRRLEDSEDDCERKVLWAAVSRVVDRWLCVQEQRGGRIDLFSI